MVWITAAVTLVIFVLIFKPFSPHKGGNPTKDTAAETPGKAENLEVYLPQAINRLQYLPQAELEQLFSGRRQEILDCLSSAGSESRAAAAELAGLLGWKEALPRILDLLAGKDIGLQLAAVEALIELGDREVVERILDEKERFLPARVGQVLIGLDKIALPEIAVRLPGAADEDKKFLVEIIGEMQCDNPEILRQVMSLLKDNDLEVRLKAAETAGKLGLEDAVPILAEALQSSEEKLSMQAARSLGLIGSNKAQKPLEKALANSQWPLQAGIQAALKRIAAAEEISRADDCQEN